MDGFAPLDMYYVNNNNNTTKKSLDLKTIKELIEDNNIIELKDYLNNVSNDDFVNIYENVFIKLFDENNQNAIHVFKILLETLKNVNYLPNNEIEILAQFQNLCKETDVSKYVDYFSKYKYKILYDGCLMKAVTVNNTKLASYIVEICDKDNFNPVISITKETKKECLEICCRNNNLEIFDLIVSLGGITINNNLFEIACERGYLELAKKIAKTKKFNVHHDDNNAYLTAIKLNRTEIVEWLEKNYTFEFNLLNPALFRQINFDKHVSLLNKIFNQLENDKNMTKYKKKTIVSGFYDCLINDGNIEDIKKLSLKYELDKDILTSMFNKLVKKTFGTTVLEDGYLKDIELTSVKYEEQEKFYQVFLWLLSLDETLFNLEEHASHLCPHGNIFIAKWISDKYPDVTVTIKNNFIKINFITSFVKIKKQIENNKLDDVKLLEEKTQCPICYDYNKYVIALGCKHYYCLECYEKVVENKSQELTDKCGLCTLTFNKKDIKLCINKELTEEEKQTEKDKVLNVLTNILDIKLDKDNKEDEKNTFPHILADIVGINPNKYREL